MVNICLSLEDTQKLSWTLLERTTAVDQCLFIILGLKDKHSDVNVRGRSDDVWSSVAWRMNLCRAALHRLPLQSREMSLHLWKVARQ